MRIYWSERLFGPLRIGGTLWRSKPKRRRGPVYHGELPGWRCPHDHRRPDTAQECARAEARRRGMR